MTAESVRIEREERERRARTIAAFLPTARYYAADNEVRNEETHKVAFAAESHWDACLIMMAAHERDTEEWTDAYGRTGEKSDCDVCQGAGVEYDETCLTCGGFGWIRS